MKRLSANIFLRNILFPKDDSAGIYVFQYFLQNFRVKDTATSV